MAKNNKFGVWGLVFVIVLLGLFFYSKNVSNSVKISPYCGDGVCNGNESFSTCSADCVNETVTQQGCDLYSDCNCEAMVDDGSCVVSGTGIGVLLEDASTGCLIDPDTHEVGISCRQACGCVN